MPETPPYSCSDSDCLKQWASDAQKGLTSAQVRTRAAEQGPNRLDDPPPDPWWVKFLGQFKDLLILILIGAALISGVMGEWIDAGVILAIVLLNALLGYFQEAKAEKALASLIAMTAPHSRVLRDGQIQEITADGLVPGDVVVLEAGDRVPADLRLISTAEFLALEAALTGESVPVAKTATELLPPETPLAERRNLAFMGTVVAGGKAHGLVVATGMRTELGKIAELIHHAAPEPTPLQLRLAELGKFLVAVCLLLIAVIVALQVWQGRAPAEVFFLSVSLAVAAVPEGLPAIVTMALALGLQRMVRRNVIIRKLPSVETLGSVTCICSDKTGTLTHNQMSIRFLATPDRLYRVSGVGYEPEGEFHGRELPALGELDRAFGVDDPSETAVDPNSTEDLRRLLEIGLHCNGASLQREEGDGAWSVLGDPTEGALLVAARKAGLGDGPTEPLSERPFDSERKCMSVTVRQGEGIVQFTKGAPEALLALCDRVVQDGAVVELDGRRREYFEAVVSGMSSAALRTLALAYRDDVGEAIEERRLIFAGIAGMIDPPREEVKPAVVACRRAGIRPVMITGDHPATALAIGRELGIAGPQDVAVSGAELDQADDAALRDLAATTSVYARVSPEHKLKIVQALKANGEIVAMTGDGVNDAPALKRADIGIAMGITGTAVTQEAASMILVDDNFASIAAAVEEGRGIYDNIQKFVLYLLGCNFAELLFVLIATMLGWPIPLLAIQILWLNLVTDGPPALALGVEPPEPDIMERPPRPPREPVITVARGLRILAFGSSMAGVTLIAFDLGYRQSEELARTMAFATLSFSQLMFAFSCRSQRMTMPQLGPWTNLPLLGAIALSAALQIGAIQLPYVSETIFRTVPLDLERWSMVLGLALIPVTAIELAKIGARWFTARRA